jgi:tyrosine-protein kinase Etk/Wzc
MPAVESLRSFRAALQFSMPHFKNNIVMFAGPTRGWASPSCRPTSPP